MAAEPGATTERIAFFQLAAGCPDLALNQDAVGAWPHEDGLLFALADGVGPHAAGELASTTALEVLGREMERAPGEWPIPKRLRRAVQEANLAVYNKAMTVPELEGIGTSLLATVLSSGALVTAHVGGCRLLLWRKGELQQLTKDHTWVWEAVEDGILVPEDARRHPRRNLLTRRLGGELVIAIDLLRLWIAPGDVVLHCSDGLHGLIPEAEIAAFCAELRPDAVCRALVRRARELGARDDVSVQVAAVGGEAPSHRGWWPFAR